ncbi:MAG: hypothetical protein KC731_12825 [Myxococcales bacterium]|nr:hypothetical protein [Myxococcales bacterium]
MADDGTLWFGKPVATLHPGTGPDVDKAQAGLSAAAKKAGAERLVAMAEEGGPLADFLIAVMVLSPFLGHQIERQAGLLESLFDTPVEDRLSGVLARVEAMRLSLEE